MINDFVIELPGLQWDKDFLLDDLARCWERKLNTTDDGQYMTVKPKLGKFSKIKEELARISKQLPGLNFSVNGYHYLCIGKNSVVMPHTDLDRQASLNIPLIGDIENTPIRFHSSASLKKESVIFEHAYTCATLVNTIKCHSVVNRSAVDRYIFSVSVYTTWQELVEILSNSTLTQQQ